MWPFKKRDNPLTEYNKLRSSVGMAPASNDDYYEYVAWVVVYDLLAQEVADECNCVPVADRDLFMMTYAAYLSWLAMKCVESKFPPDSWRLIAPLLKREFSKQPWYQEEVMKRLFDSMVEYPKGEIKGRYLNASAGPWFDAVMATQFASFKLGLSTNARFNLYVTVMSNHIVETISKTAPSAKAGCPTL